ncbi:hypothetical protein NC658_20240 [Streptomyces griseoincarnatus]|uniref:Uncharacterized protein n=1 Tax=Streptomyces griseoincarnatus TaxID=29305 RepID=A0ABT0VWD3_STRGI|nr:hypothetical protein [Streptomyces griseoincarnatus]MCM2515567.1 hypothetical protein [Streptomyces griseoincarnatus]
MPGRGRAGLLGSGAVFYYVATASSPAMVTARVGTGSQYAYTAEASTGVWLDGGRNYTLTLLSGIPVRTSGPSPPTTPRPGRCCARTTPTSELRHIHPTVREAVEAARTGT